MLPFLDIIVNEGYRRPVILHPRHDLDTVVESKDSLCDSITVGKDSLVDSLSSMHAIPGGLDANYADSSMLVWTIIISFAALVACLVIAHLYRSKS